MAHVENASDCFRDEKGHLTAVAWANWAVTGNDAIYPHQVPFVLKELHSRIVQAVSQAVRDSKQKE